MKNASRTTGTAASMTTSTRMERDTMGELPVPSNAYYGVQTARRDEVAYDANAHPHYHTPHQRFKITDGGR